MKKIILFVLLLMAAGIAHSQQSKYVILVTVDGFRPDFYLDASWGTPNLHMMKDSGVSAKGVNPIFPSVTYPDHTTIITGVPPAKHGIYYNAPFEPQGASGEWYFHYDSIKVPTLFDAALLRVSSSGLPKEARTVIIPISKKYRQALLPGVQVSTKVQW